MADGLQESVAKIAGVSVVRDHQRSGHQGCQQLEHCIGCDALTGTDCLGCLQGPATREDGQSGQEPLFRLGAQLIGPVDRGPQRLVTLDRSPPPATQHREALIQSIGQHARAHRGNSRRGELDRERDPVETPTDLNHRAHIAVREHEISFGGPRPITEQLDRLGRGSRVEIRPLARRAERGHHQVALPVDAEALAAGGQHHQPRARTLQDLDQVPHLAQEMLTVVQDQQELLRSQELDKRVDQALPGTSGNTEHRRDRPSHPLGVSHRRQLHKPGPLPEPGQRLGRHLQRQARLAHSADPGQRHHPGLPQRFADPVELPLATNERAHLQRQVPRERIQGRQRRKLAPQTRRAHLENTLSAR